MFVYINVNWPKKHSPKLWQICPETSVCVAYLYTLVVNKQNNMT